MNTSLPASFYDRALTSSAPSLTRTATPLLDDSGQVIGRIRVAGDVTPGGPTREHDRSGRETCT